MGNEKSIRVQVGLLVLCAVVGVVIIAWMISQRQTGAGRKIVVDRALHASTAATSRYAVTRPLKMEFFDAIDKKQHDKAMEMLKADPLLVTTEIKDAGYATPLHLAAFVGDRELAAAMLEAGANLEAREIRHDGTPLEWAVFAGDVEMVRFLLEKGAKVDTSCLMAAHAGTQKRAFLTTQPAKYREIQKLILPKAPKAGQKVGG